MQAAGSAAPAPSKPELDLLNFEDLAIDPASASPLPASSANQPATPADYLSRWVLCVSFLYHAEGLYGCLMMWNPSQALVHIAYLYFFPPSSLPFCNDGNADCSSCRLWFDQVVAGVIGLGLYGFGGCARSLSETAFDPSPAPSSDPFGPSTLGSTTDSYRSGQSTGPHTSARPGANPFGPSSAAATPSGDADPFGSRPAHVSSGSEANGFRGAAATFGGAASFGGLGGAENPAPSPAAAKVPAGSLVATPG